MNRRSVFLLSLVVAGLFVFAACADPAQPTATPVDFDPTPGGGQPDPTATSTAGTTAPQPTTPPAGPDPDAGQAIFATNCTVCHNTSSETLVGPGLAGVGERAASRIPGKSADEYLRESIMEPSAFVVDGFAPIMPPFATLGDSNISNLIAYLKTLQ